MILLVEDDARIAGFVMRGLKEEGYRCEWVSDGHQALESVLKRPWTVVILDLMLPGCSGHEILARMRKKGCDTPVLVLSAKGRAEERAEGLNQGADDYLSKPFSFLELVARVRALERRPRTFMPSTLAAGDIELDLLRYQARFRGREIELTEQEFRLLECFVRHPRRVYSKEQLAQWVWEHRQDVDDNAIEAGIRRLRRKLGERATESCIETLRGAGYRLNPRDT